MLHQEGENGMSLLIPTKIFTQKKKNLILRVVLNKMENTEILSLSKVL